MYGGRVRPGAGTRRRSRKALIAINVVVFFVTTSSRRD